MTSERQASIAVGLIDGFRKHQIGLEDQIAILRIAVAFAKTIAEEASDSREEIGI